MCLRTFDHRLLLDLTGTQEPTRKSVTVYRQGQVGRAVEAYEAYEEHRAQRKPATERGV